MSGSNRPPEDDMDWDKLDQLIDQRYLDKTEDKTAKNETSQKGTFKELSQNHKLKHEEHQQRREAAEQEKVRVAQKAKEENIRVAIDFINQNQEFFTKAIKPEQFLSWIDEQLNVHDATSQLKAKKVPAQIAARPKEPAINSAQLSLLVDASQNLVDALRKGGGLEISGGRKETIASFLGRNSFFLGAVLNIRRNPELKVILDGIHEITRATTFDAILQKFEFFNNLSEETNPSFLMDQGKIILNDIEQWKKRYGMDNGKKLIDSVNILVKINQEIVDKMEEFQAKLIDPSTSYGISFSALHHQFDPTAESKTIAKPSLASDLASHLVSWLTTEVSKIPESYKNLHSGFFSRQHNLGKAEELVRSLNLVLQDARSTTPISKLTGCILRLREENDRLIKKELDKKPAEMLKIPDDFQEYSARINKEGPTYKLMVSYLLKLLYDQLNLEKTPSDVKNLKNLIARDSINSPGITYITINDQHKSHCNLDSFNSYLEKMAQKQPLSVKKL